MTESAAARIGRLPLKTAFVGILFGVGALLFPEGALAALAGAAVPLSWKHLPSTTLREFSDRLF